MKSLPPLQSPDSTPPDAATPSYTVRLASPPVADGYPLSITGAAEWLPSAVGFASEITLPAIDAGAIVVPSFSMPGASDCAFRFELHARGQRWLLDPVPVHPAFVADAAHNQAAAAGAHTASAVPAVTTHVDCWHTHARLADVRLRIEVASEARPQTGLLSIAVRPRVLQGRAGNALAPRLAVPPVSQMTAAPAIRRRICSPTCVAMVLAYYGVDVALAEIAARCHDAANGIYGSWPLAIHAAARHGLVGSVETFHDLDDAARLIERDVPVIASIDFEHGALAGAPLERSAGHLVVVTGIDRERVYVNDPAADDEASVARDYDRHQFAAAWLDRRGVGYVIAPLASRQCAR